MTAHQGHISATFIRIFAKKEKMKVHLLSSRLCGVLSVPSGVNRGFMGDAADCVKNYIVPYRKCLTTPPMLEEMSYGNYHSSYSHPIHILAVPPRPQPRPMTLLLLLEPQMYSVCLSVGRRLGVCLTYNRRTHLNQHGARLGLEMQEQLLGHAQAGLCHPSFFPHLEVR